MTNAHKFLEYSIERTDDYLKQISREERKYKGQFLHQRKQPCLWLIYLIMKAYQNLYLF